MSEFYIGLMSGTSIDSIDAALIAIEPDGTTRFVQAHSHPIDTTLKQDIYHLCHTDNANLDRVGACDRQLGELFAAATLVLLKQAGLQTCAVRAIGSHGQTIRHRPNQAHGGPFTWQIGDPNVIAVGTGIDTVADFRRMDMAAGGQAAPLAPIFHQALFGSGEVNRTLCNIGGISNVTWLPADGDICGFDLGPGNALMDAWVLRHRDLPFDADGQWASSGQINEDLLRLCMAHPFLAQTGPKSTGREEFNMAWLEPLIAQSASQDSPVNIQATLLEFTAQSICQGLGQQFLGQEFFVCGGGAHNKALMQRLGELVAPATIATTQSLGIAPDWVEACGFAWLAHQRLQRQPGNHPQVTGAQSLQILGGVYAAGGR
jgi:anhydro-N-acetylmuramic acid kinase